MMGEYGFLVQKILRPLAEGRLLFRVLRSTARWFGPALAAQAVMRSLSTFPKIPWDALFEFLGPTEFRRPFAGRRVAWHRVDLGLIWSIFDDQTYSRNPGMRIQDRQTIIDAGAHIGVFTIFAALQNPRGRVVAVEPNRRRFEILRKNVKLNGLENVIMINAALSNFDGMATLYHGASGTGADSIVHTPTTHGEEVRVISMDSLLRKCDISHVDFMKLDIEGAEHQLFSGDVSWLHEVDRIAMEFHMWVSDPDRVLEALSRSGFEITLKRRRVADDHRLIYAIRSTRA